MARAEDLFLRIEQEGLLAIDQLIADQASEELFLDFKRSADEGSGKKLHDRDKTNLKKSVCGFSNSEGGIIVWGVDCSPSPQNSDTASKKIPINNPHRFVSWLEGAISGLTIPPAIGVRSIAIEISNELGFVITLIPRSNRAPHQLVGEGKYIIRAGSDFVPAPHGVVAGLFGRPPHPVVFPNFKISPTEVITRTNHGENELILRCKVTVVLVNDGNVVAEDLFATFFFPTNIKDKLWLSYANDGWSQTSGFGIDTSFLTNREVRLAPRGSIIVCEVVMEIGNTNTSDFQMRLTTGCKGAIPDERTCSVSKDDLIKIKEKAIATYNSSGRSDKNFWFDITKEIFGI